MIIIILLLIVIILVVIAIQYMNFRDEQKNNNTIASTTSNTSNTPNIGSSTSKPMLVSSPSNLMGIPDIDIPDIDIPDITGSTFELPNFDIPTFSVPSTTGAPAPSQPQSPSTTTQFDQPPAPTTPSAFVCPPERKPPCQYGYIPEQVEIDGKKEDCCFLDIREDNPVLIAKILSDPEVYKLLGAGVTWGYLSYKLGNIFDKPYFKQGIGSLSNSYAMEAAEKAAQEAAEQYGEELARKGVNELSEDVIKAELSKRMKDAYNAKYLEVFKDKADKLLTDFMKKYGSGTLSDVANKVKYLTEIFDKKPITAIADDAAQYAVKYIDNLPKVSTKLTQIIDSVKSAMVALRNAKIGARAAQITSKTIVSVAPKIGVRIGTRVAAAVGGIATRLGIKASMGPVGWASMVFDILTIGLDVGDPGGYSDATLQDVYDEMKKKTDETLRNEIEKNGMKYPPVVGPKPVLNISPTEVDDVITRLIRIDLEEFYDSDDNPKIPQSELDQKINDRRQYYNDYKTTPEGIYKILIVKYTIDYVTQNIKAYIDSLDVTNLTENEYNELLNTKINSLTGYLETPSGVAVINKKLCDTFDGKYINETGECTYKDRASCYASFEWPLKKDASDNPINPMTTYKNDVCYFSGHENLRELCEKNGLRFDQDKEECVITDVYCMTKGMDYKSNGTKGDCTVNPGQFAAELILGTTVVRGLKQVFDPNQYLPCRDDEIDLARDTPEWFRLAMQIITYISLVVVPLRPFVDWYNIAGNKMCLKKEFSCPAFMERGGVNETGGFCYIPCDKHPNAISDPHKDSTKWADGNTHWKNDGEVMCYKTYQGWENYNDNDKNLLGLTKRTILASRPEVAGRCTDQDACDQQCSNDTQALNDKYRYVSTEWKADGVTRCYKKYRGWENYNDNDKNLTSVTKRIVTTDTGKPYSDCPDGYTRRGVVCYENCPANGTDGSYWESDGTHGCYKRPAYWPGNTSITHLQHDTIYSTVKAGLTDCPDGYEKVGALCYGQCPKPEADGSYWESDGVQYCYKRPKTWAGNTNTLYLAHDTYWSPGVPKVLKCTDPNYPDFIDGLCYAKCPAGKVHIAGMPYKCGIPCDGNYRSDPDLCMFDGRIIGSQDKWWGDKCWGAKVYDECPAGYTKEPATCMRHASCHTYWDGCCYTIRC